MTATVPPATGAAAAAIPPFPDPSHVAVAHTELLRDKSLQFDFPELVTKQNPPPQWLLDALRGIGRFIQFVGYGWTVLFWLMIGAIVLAILLAIFPGLRDAAMGLIRRGRAGLGAEPPRWAPQAAAARRLLEEADHLAAQGQYDQAVHLILHRSIEDIEQWQGDLVRPSLTSRDIARAEALPDQARAVFDRIVLLVEASFFGGGKLTQQDWTRARSDYAGFALKPS